MDPVVAALLTVMGTASAALGRAFLRGDLIAGSIYREKVAEAERERARADRAEVIVEANTEALKEVTSTVKLALEQRGVGLGDA